MLFIHEDVTAWYVENYITPIIPISNIRYPGVTCFSHDDLQFTNDDNVPRFKPHVHKGVLLFHYYTVNNSFSLGIGRRGSRKGARKWMTMHTPPNSQLWMKYPFLYSTYKIYTFYLNFFIKSTIFSFERPGTLIFWRKSLDIIVFTPPKHYAITQREGGIEEQLKLSASRKTCFG